MNRNTNIFNYENASDNVVCKMSVICLWLYCFNPDNGATCTLHDTPAGSQNKSVKHSLSPAWSLTRWRCEMQYTPWNIHTAISSRVHTTTDALQLRHNGRDSVSNHQPHDCSLNRLFRRRSKKTSKLRVTGLCERDSPGTREFPGQMASNAENVSIWWHHSNWK